MIILDTDVLSELMRPKPSARVVTWVAKQPATELFTTSITEAEIFCGIELLTKGKRRGGLLAAAEAMFTDDLAGRIFGFESDAARVFSRLPLTAVRSADLSATRMRRLQPLPKYEGPNSRRVMLQTSRTVILISLTPGMVRKPWLSYRNCRRVLLFRTPRLGSSHCANSSSPRSGSARGIPPCDRRRPSAPRIRAGRLLRNRRQKPRRTSACAAPRVLLSCSRSARFRGLMLSTT